MSHELLIQPSVIPELRNYILMDVRQDAAAYAAGHLRGAIHADLNRQLSSATDPGFDPALGGRHPLPPLDRFLQQLGAWGVDPTTHVVLYDDQSGANAATRLWWMLRAVGHEHVSLIDGGFQAAVAAGAEVTGEVVRPAQKPPYPADGWSLPAVDLAKVDELRTRSDWKVLDVRSRERFRGDTEPFDPVAGHIPGALNLPYPENLEGGRFKPAEALREQYRALLGATPPEKLVVHCGSGVTACHTLFALELAGLSGASLYVGSWSEWCRNEVPQARGER